MTSQNDTIKLQYNQSRLEYEKWPMSKQFLSFSDKIVLVMITYR